MSENETPDTGQEQGPISQEDLDALVAQQQGQDGADAAGQTADGPSQEGPVSQEDLDALIAKEQDAPPADADGEADEGPLGQDQLDQLLAQAKGEPDPQDSPEAAEAPAPAAVDVAPAQFAPLPQEQAGGQPRDIDIILDIPVEITVELGRTTMTIEDVMSVGPGSVIELDKLASEPIEIFVNDKLIASGEVVVVEDKLGVRIGSVVEPGQRIRNLG